MGIGRRRKGLESLGVCKRRRALCWKAALYPGFRGRQSGEGMRGGELRRLPGQWGKAALENKWELTADADSSASYSWQWIKRLKQGRVIFIYICVCIYMYACILFLKGCFYFHDFNYFKVACIGGATITQSFAETNLLLLVSQECPEASCRDKASLCQMLWKHHVYVWFIVDFESPLIV